MINERTCLLVLQSITRSFLLHRSPGLTIPLAGLNVEAFASTTWHDLGIQPAGAAELAQKLKTMFPGLDRDTDLGDTGTCPEDCANAAFKSWLRGERNIVYESSGSSGKPKYLIHRLEAVAQEVETIARLFPDINQVVGLTPQHHCYGFIFGVLLHQRLGAAYKVLPPLPTIISHALTEKTLFVGYPGLWAGVKIEQNFSGRSIICLSAGSPWPEANMAQLQGAGLGVLEIYGSSENGAVGYRRGCTDFTLLGYLKKVTAFGGLETLCRHLPSGETLCLPLQDIVAWSGDRTFRPLKRVDGAVQISGINVYPARAAQLIAEHPLVRQCRVRQMRPDEGTRLKAFVVPVNAGTDTRQLRAELKRWCTVRLNSPERPASFKFGQKLPINDFGKDADWDI